jgi:hypothetical protein
MELLSIPAANIHACPWNLTSRFLDGDFARTHELLAPNSRCVEMLVADLP